MTQRLSRIDDLMQRLHLAPHPEGGFYAEVHRAVAQVQPLGDARGPRAALTSIYFLLVGHEEAPGRPQLRPPPWGAVGAQPGPGGSHSFSRWHRVASDEVWCHLEGAPLRLHQLDEATHAVSQTLLCPVGEGVQPQATVPAGTWQAAQCTGAYSLVACMVAPGFAFSDFTLMDPALPLADWLRATHPALAALI